MNDEESHGREGEAGKRIASLVRSIGQGPQKNITREEVQKLKAAGERLDQILKAAAESDRQALNDVAARLDQLLVDIRKGKGVVGLKQEKKTTL